MNSPLNLSQRACLGAIVLWAAAFPLPAEVVASYVAPANPTLPEWGWTSAGRTSAGTEVTQPENAWRIAPEKGNALGYAIASSESILRNAFAKGWTYSARIRLDPAPNSSIGRYVASLGVENAEKKQAFVAWVRTDETDGTLLVEFNRKIIRLPDLSPSAFHDYAITYDPISSTARLTVDGQAVSDPIQPTPTERWYLRWGHNSGTAVGAAEWASVKFETPSPAAP